MAKLTKIIALLIIILVVTLSINIYQWMKNKKLTVEIGNLTINVDSLAQKNKELETQRNELIEEKKALEFSEKESDQTLTKYIESKQYKNEKYGFEIKLFADQNPHETDRSQNKRSDMPRRIWESSVTDSDYGLTLPSFNTGRTGGPFMFMTVNQCFSQEDINSCLAATGSCYMIPYEKFEETYKKDIIFETSSGPNFIDSPCKRTKVSCMEGEVEEGVAILRNNKLYTISFLTSSKDYKPLPKIVGELIISSFTFIE